MKRNVLLIGIFVCLPLLAANKRISTIILPRTAASNGAQTVCGWQDIINVGPGNTYASTVEYDLSFRPERILQCLFGNALVKCKNTLTFSGSQRAHRTRRHWLADYFGVPTDFESKLRLCPRISSAIIDLAWYGSSSHIPGGYIYLHVPLVYSQWDLHMCETLISTGSYAYDPGYFNPEGISRAQLLDSITAFITGKEAPKATNVMFNALTKAKMSPHAEHLVKVSDISFALGWNPIMCKRYHAGGGFSLIIPTGNRPTGDYLFEPIIGNGHHWQIGGHLSTHILLWENQQEDEYAGIYGNASITTMLKTKQCRSFDLCGSTNSRYMLAQKMEAPREDVIRGMVDGVLTAPIAIYQKEVTTVANLTTVEVEVSCNVVADITVMVGYTKGRNSWGLGYEFWARSCESLSFCNPSPFAKPQWALKGDAQLFGFEDNAQHTAVTLSATESKATIHHGTNAPSTGASTQTEVVIAQQNLHVDNPAYAFGDSTKSGTFIRLVLQPGGTQHIKTSIEPILLTPDDIDIDSARTRGRSHKLFSHFTHTIPHNPTIFIGFGAQAEFGQDASCSDAVRARKDPCLNTALSVWGVWIKGGVSF